MRDPVRVELEEKLDDLVAEYQLKGLDLMEISSILELKKYAVDEALTEES